MDRLEDERHPAAASPSRVLGGDAQLTATVLDVLDVGVLVVDDQRRLTRSNPAAAAILGADPGVREVGTWWQLVVPQRGRGTASDPVETVLRTGRGVREVAMTVDRPDGAVVALSVDHLPLQVEGGPVSGVVITFRDVTELTRLKSTQKRMREAHDVARMTSWEWRPDTDDIALFDARVDDTDRPEGGVNTLAALMAPLTAEDDAEARENLAGFVRGTYDESVRLHRRVIRGREVWLETRARAVRGADGQLLSVRGTSQDVTAQEVARRELTAARDFFQATLDSFPARVVVLDEAGEVLTTNRSWKEDAEARGRVAAGEPGNYLTACDAAEDDEFAVAAGAGLRAVAAGEQDQFRLVYPRVDGGVQRWFLMRASLYQGPGPARIVVSHDDITDGHRARQQIRTQAALLDEIDVAVIATDVARTVTHWNRAAEGLYGWTRDEALGSLVSDLIVPDDGTAGVVRAALDAVGRWEGEFRVRRKDGTVFPAEVRNRMMVDAAGRPSGVIGVSTDITERVAADRDLVEARDYMRTVADSMGQGLLTLDVDGRLSYVNPTAEALLGWSQAQLRGRSMAAILVTADRSLGPTVEEESFEQARRAGVPHRVEDAVFLRSDGAELPVAYTAVPFETASGVQGRVVLFEDISERKAYEEALLRDADRLSWIGRVQEALDDDGFVLHAQPIIDVRTGEVVQRELLLRMSEPDGRIVGPRMFLPIAEKYGLIGDIDRWVIEQAAAIAATGRSVELNISARSVGDPAIIEHIERCLRAVRADPVLLVFEITETALMEDEPSALAFAERIHALGSKLALDDFGTGYGTFTYIKNLPLDFLKIDIDFVRDLASNRASRHVVQAVVALADAFGLQTVAEGVEDGETLELLGELGVDRAQGFFIARPEPIDVSRDVRIGGRT